MHYPDGRIPRNHESLLLGMASALKSSDESTVFGHKKLLKLFLGKK